MANDGCAASGIKLAITVLCSLLATGLGVIFLTQLYPVSSAFLTYTLALGFGCLTFVLLEAIQIHGSGDVERGESFSPTWWIRVLSWWKTRDDRYPFYWGGMMLPFSAGKFGLAAIGAPGSGKTVSLRLFLQSTMPYIGVAPDHRALIYDAKGEMLPILAGMGIDTRPNAGLVKILHPYDGRSYAWDMCRDIADIETNAVIALLFVPINPQEKDPMWSKAARSLLRGVLDAFVLARKEWTLRDLCCATMNQERLRMVLAECPSTRPLIDQFLDKGRTTDGIIIQLRSGMEEFQGIASLWNYVPKERMISLTEWLNDKKGTILLLGPGEEGTPLGSINQIIIKRIGQLIKHHQSDSPTRRTWIVIDELRQCGRLDLMPIANMGRGRGAALVIGYQDQSGLRDAYSDDGASELLGMCQHKAIFSLSSDITAEWASRQFGTREVLEQGRTLTQSAVLPSEFTSTRHMPETNERNGLTGYYKSVTLGAYKAKMPGRKLFSQWLRPLDESVKGVIRLQPNDYPFEDWTNADLERLGYREIERTQPEPTKYQAPSKEETRLELNKPTDENPLHDIGRRRRNQRPTVTDSPLTNKSIENAIQNGRWDD